MKIPVTVFTLCFMLTGSIVAGQRADSVTKPDIIVFTVDDMDLSLIHI